MVHQTKLTTCDILRSSKRALVSISSTSAIPKSKNLKQKKKNPFRLCLIKFETFLAVQVQPVRVYQMSKAVLVQLVDLGFQDVRRVNVVSFLEMAQDTLQAAVSLSLDLIG